MTEPLFMGIDGGGSKLRVSIVNGQLDELSSQVAGAANPSVIGRDTARARIQRGIVEALSSAGCRHDHIAAVGIGIAGAANLHSEGWLLDTMAPVLPASRLVASSDLEIALVGALARRHGILLLAGTGSAAFGVRPDGASLQVGGWGYLLGDEGSSFWIGAQLLRRLTQACDSGAEARSTTLNRTCLDELGLADARDLVAWVYRAEETAPARVASLAPFVLARADKGDAQAVAILEAAAEHLVGQVEALRRRLHYNEAPIAFAGGLLDNANRLSDLVARRLGLCQRPLPEHPPVIGAALLAKMEWSAENSL